MRLIPFDSMTDIHVRLAKASEATAPSDERRGAYLSTDDDRTVCEAPRTVRRLTLTSGWTTPGIKGGEQHSGAEVEDSCVPLIVGLVGAATVIVSAIFLR